MWYPAHQVPAGVLDADVTKQTEDSTVNVTGGFMSLRGAVIPFSYHRQPEEPIATVLRIKLYSRFTDPFVLWAPARTPQRLHFQIVVILLLAFEGGAIQMDQYQITCPSAQASGIIFHQRLRWYKRGR